MLPLPPHQTPLCNPLPRHPARLPKVVARNGGAETGLVLECQHAQACQLVSQAAYVLLQARVALALGADCGVDGLGFAPGFGADSGGCEAVVFPS